MRKIAISAAASSVACVVVLVGFSWIFGRTPDDASFWAGILYCTIAGLFWPRSRS